MMGKSGMKYSTDIIIALPRQEVVALFDSAENLAHWQDGFVSMTPLSDTPTAPGAKAKLVYQMGKRRIEMVETIETYNFPDEFTATYEAKGVWNRNANFFEEIDPGQTRWRQESEFRFTGFMKIIGWIMPGAFPKQSNKFMQDFKAFAEQGAR